MCIRGPGVVRVDRISWFWGNGGRIVQIFYHHCRRTGLRIRRSWRWETPWVNLYSYLIPNSGPGGHQKCWWNPSPPQGFFYETLSTVWPLLWGLACGTWYALGLRPSRVDASDGFSIASYYTLFFLLKLFGHSLSAGYCTYRGWTENIMVMIWLMNDWVMLAVGRCCLYSTLSTIGVMGITLRTIDTDGNATLAPCCAWETVSR